MSAVGSMGSLVNDETWVAHAVCAETDPEVFFPEKGNSNRQAKLICEGCPVRLECLDYALRKPEQHGIWGGFSDRERKGMRPKPRYVDHIRCSVGHVYAKVGKRDDGSCAQCFRDRRRRYDRNRNRWAS